MEEIVLNKGKYFILNEEMEMKRFCFIGVRGIGKTTLIHSVLPELPHLDYVLGSDILRSLVQQDGNDFRQFDFFPEGLKMEYRRRSIQQMIKRQVKNRKTILVDGHVSLYNPQKKRVECVFTPDDCVFFTDFILYETSADKVMKRRKNDKNKNRILDMEIIREEILREREIAFDISLKHNIKMYYLNEIEFSNFRELQCRLFEILSP